MKIYYTFLVLFLMNFSSVSAQNTDTDDETDKFSVCEITLVDGTKLKGFIAYFLDAPKNIDVEDIYGSSYESAFNMDDSGGNSRSGAICKRV